MEAHGELVQVEADALPPTVLRDLLTEAMNEFYDRDAYGAVVKRETQLRQRLEEAVNELDSGFEDDKED
jgi:hypothetical protein